MISDVVEVRPLAPFGVAPFDPLAQLAGSTADEFHSKNQLDPNDPIEETDR